MMSARKVPIACTGLFLWLLPLQFLFAGYGVFSGRFTTHEFFGGAVLHGITLLMAISFAVARQWRLAGISFALVAVIFVQIALVSIGRDADAPWLSAVHPFLAFCYWPFVYFAVWGPARAELRAPSDRRTDVRRPRARARHMRPRGRSRVR